MTGKRRISAQLLSFALLAAVVAACGPQNNRNEKFAREGRHGHGVRVACAGEIEKYCANADKRRRCLRQNMDKLGETCKTALAQHHNRGGDNANTNNGNNGNNNKTNNNNNGDDNDDN